MITNGLYKPYPNYRFSALGFTKLTGIWQITNFHKTTVLLSEMRSLTFDAAWSPRFRESAGILTKSVGDTSGQYVLEMEPG